jgi:hypothetical protein
VCTGAAGKIPRYGKIFQFGGICDFVVKSSNLAENRFRWNLRENLQKSCKNGGNWRNIFKIPRNFDFGRKMQFLRKKAISAENLKKLQKIPENCDFEIVAMRGIDAGACGGVEGSV